MSAVFGNIGQWSGALSWLRDFLKEELAPRPGRLVLVFRMVIAATLVMILNMTFRIPYGVFGVVYALIISREDPHATVEDVKGIFIAFGFAAIYILIGAAIFAGDPILRFLWVVGTLFAVFYSLSAIRNHVAAVRFGYLIIVTIPLWDLHTTAETKVDNTLWAVGAVSMAILITTGVELVFAALRPADDVFQSVDERLFAVEDVLRSCISVLSREKGANRIAHFSMLGTSRLRRILRHSEHSLDSAEKLGAVVTLVGRLVDIAANLEFGKLRLSENDRIRIRALADNVAEIRSDLTSGKVPRPVKLSIDHDLPSSVPLLNEMEMIIAMIPHAFEESQSLGIHAPLASADQAPITFFAADAFSSPEHVKFGLRGCLAASLCYTLYNVLAWPEISTAVTTCFVTALSSIGSSRQKQALRFGGAIAGGVAGISAQVFILPCIDSITAFALLFAFITVIAAWVSTSGPRLSYFGIQLAVAFYFINVQEFKFQTSLAVARDRVVGVLLGLLMMWFVFDRLWGVPAIVQMKNALVSLLRTLAQLSREPLSNDLEVAVQQSYSLREKVNQGFDQIRDLADSVLFEFGPRRQEYLKSRSQILVWQPQMRILFVTRVALLKYRLLLPGFELPKAVRIAQQEFDEHLARTLEGMADRFAAKPSPAIESLEDSFKNLEEMIKECESIESAGPIAPRLRTFLELSRRIESLVLSLDGSVEST